jgi:hypothetical protein
MTYAVALPATSWVGYAHPQHFKDIYHCYHPRQTSLTDLQKVFCTTQGVLTRIRTI